MYIWWPVVVFPRGIEASLIPGRGVLAKQLVDDNHVVKEALTLY